MPFTSPSFNDAKVILSSAGHSSTIPVEPLVLATPTGWRLLGLIRLVLYLAYRRNPFFWLLWFLWRAFSGLLGLCFPNSKLGDVLQGRRPGHELILRFSLITIANLGPKRGWMVFWVLYFTYGDPDRFQQNYMEAWRQRFAEEQKLQLPNPESLSFQSDLGSNACSVIVFRDSGRPLLMPCRWDMTDEQFIRHIRLFYYLQRLGGGFLELFSLKTINFVEVVKLEQRFGVGFHQYYLNLARYGSGNRLIHFWLSPSQLSGTSIVERITADAVLAAPALQDVWAPAVPMQFSAHLAASQQQQEQQQEQQQQQQREAGQREEVAAQSHALGGHQMALNIVNKWHTDAAGAVVAVPLLASLIACMTWPAVAVVVYHGDVNISVQTGFGIASYLITAGAILIAVVAFLDTQNEKVKVP